VLLDNGVIRTLDPSRPVASGLLVEDEHVAAVGDDLEHRERFDLDGPLRRARPGRRPHALRDLVDGAA
jgi:predicted amidohydrolase YtcJ